MHAIAKRLLLILIILVSLHPCKLVAQKITFSDIEKKDYHRFFFKVIAKYKKRILVYKTTYNSRPFNSPVTATELTVFQTDPSPIYPIYESAINLYDEEMKLISAIRLPLPKEITGVHFLVYNSFFYLFYQYQRGHIIYCMAVKINTDGTVIGQAEYSTDMLPALHE